MAGTELGLVLTALLFGVRHGVDWDHIAAIADIAGSRPGFRRSLGLSTLYALGHAAVVFALGVAAIVAGGLLPAEVDAVMERVVGLTLVALGLYLFYALLRHGRGFRFRSRWALVIGALKHGLARLRRATQPDDEVVIVHEHDHEHGDGHHLHDHGEPGAGDLRGTMGDGAPGTKPSSLRASALTRRRHRHEHVHVATMPPDPFSSYSPGTSFAIGMLHGVGAETPTQVLLFVTAAGAGDPVAGVALLAAFLTGLLASNTLVAVGASAGFLQAERNFAVYAGIAVITAAFSLVLGSLYLLGRGSLVPPILGG